MSSPVVQSKRIISDQFPSLVHVPRKLFNEENYPKHKTPFKINVEFINRVLFSWEKQLFLKTFI